jgi:phage/conjugal plasmid C-4 type zinc finger TraR family protein
MDDCDIASRNEGFLNRVMLANARQRTQAAADETPHSYHECIDCDDPIPEARRMAQPGCVRCAICQSIFEKGR